MPGKQFTDEDIINALNKCIEEACIPAASVAEKLGASPRYIKDRMVKLRDEGVLESKMVGNTWCFRPKK